MIKDSLGDRMKCYENVTRFYNPRHTYTILRIDGKSFHTYTKGLNKPFDLKLMEDLRDSTFKLLEEIQGSKMAYIQSDEISILVSDFDTLETSAWFDSNIQKMCSVASSVFTAWFNYYRIDESGKKFKPALFDCRVFTIPQIEEVANYFVWRTKDCIRNSINLIAQNNFSHKRLQGMNLSSVKQLLIDNTIDINSFGKSCLNGRYFVKDSRKFLDSVVKEWVVKECESENLYEFYKNILDGIYKNDRL